MKENIAYFIEEITDNFSNLFVETLFMRYIYEFGGDNIANDVKKIKIILNKKIEQKINNKITKAL